MSEQQTSTQPVYEFKELDKFQMFTPAPGNTGKRSRLTWSSYRGNPRVTIFTQVQDDTNKGIIFAPMNPETFLIFLELLEQVARNPAESKQKLECYTLIRLGEDTNGKKSSEKVLVSDLYFGRDRDGLVWLSVVAENRPKIKFDFKISDFHKLYKGDGNSISEAEASSLQALAVIRALREVMIPHMGELRQRQETGTGNGGNARSYERSAAKANTANSKGFDDINF